MRSGEELEVKENEVAIPVPVPGRLVPIEDEIQVLPDELVGTQIAFELADEDRLLGSVILPPSRVPEWNLRTLQVVRTYLSFVSDWFPPCFRTYLPRTVHHLISPSSLPFTC